MEINAKNSNVNLVEYVNRTREFSQQNIDKTNSKTQQSVDGNDKVELSDKSREIQQAFEAAKKLPEIREEKVSEIKNQIETGSYPIEPEKIADSMLKESLENNAILNAMNM
jgi:negative regulator of flagellin synthesis FlgM